MKLKDNIENNYATIQGNLTNCNISGLDKAFTPRVFYSFNEFKEEYRIVVGHAFQKAHKKIENAELKIRTKLKLFCCHIINRVFEK